LWTGPLDLNMGRDEPGLRHRPVPPVGLPPRKRHGTGLTAVADFSERRRSCGTPSEPGRPTESHRWCDAGTAAGCGAQRPCSRCSAWPRGQWSRIPLSADRPGGLSSPAAEKDPPPRAPPVVPFDSRLVDRERPDPPADEDNGPPALARDAPERERGTGSLRLRRHPVDHLMCNRMTADVPVRRRTGVARPSSARQTATTGHPNSSKSGAVFDHQSIDPVQESCECSVSGGVHGPTVATTIADRIG
jgi:hypothetical protein